MAVKKFYINQPKEGYPYDRKKRRYFSWGFDIWLDERRKQLRGFLTEREAIEAVTALKKQQTNAELGILTPQESPYLIELFQKKLNATLDKRERAFAKRVFTSFLEIVPKRLTVPNVRKAHIKTYVDKRLNDGVVAATVKRELVPIVAALHAAGEFFEELEEYRPPKIPRPKVPKGRKNRPITFGERRSILIWLFRPRVLRERWPKQYETRRLTGLFLQFCLLTVSRPGEVAKLKKTDVDFHANLVRITGTKTRFVAENPVRELPITATMKMILEERLQKAQGDYLFTKSGAVTWKMRELMREACEANSIAYGRLADEITFSSTRHTGTTVLARSNKVDTKTAGAFTGHSDQTMTLYYTHTNKETLEIASNVLEENMGMQLLAGEFLESESQNN